MPSKKPFINFIIDPELLKCVDDFRFEHRFNSRSAAIKWLIAWALKQDPRPSDNPDIDQPDS